MRISNGDSQYVLDSKKLISLLSENRNTQKFNDFELAEKCFDHDVKYPGLGWRKTANQIMARWYKNKGEAVPKEFLNEPERGEKRYSEKMLCFIPACQKIGAWSPRTIADKGPWYCREHAKNN